MKKKKEKSEKERKEGGGEKEEEGKSTPPPVDWWFSESIREIVRCWTILKAGSIALVGLGIDKEIYIYTLSFDKCEDYAFNHRFNKHSWLARF